MATSIAHFSSAVGCYTCKKRHLKCDNATPACQRCVKSSRTCYRASSVIHIENNYASRQNKRPRGPRSQPQELVAVASPPPPIVNLKVLALGYYVRYHLHGQASTPTLLRGQSENILRLWALTQDWPVLDMAVTAMALMTFSQTKQHHPAAVEAAEQYHQLLQTARNSFTSVNADNLDVYLLAIFFMSRYESAAYQPGPDDVSNQAMSRVRSYAHHDGAQTVLKIWVAQFSDVQPASDVVKNTRRGIIRSSMIRNKAIPEWMQDGAAFGEAGLDLEYDSIVVRIANLRHRLSLLSESSQTRVLLHFAWAIEALDREAQDIDLALQHWIDRFPASWTQQQHTLPEATSEHFYLPTGMIFSYPSMSSAAIWALYYSMRMLTQCTRLRLLRLRDSFAHSDIFSIDGYEQTISSLNSLANDFAASIPYLLCRFKVIKDSEASPPSDPPQISLLKDDYEPHIASLVAWPLGIAAGICDVDPKLRSWFLAQLSDTGRVSGTKLFQCAASQSWLEL